MFNICLKCISNALKVCEKLLLSDYKSFTTDKTYRAGALFFLLYLYVKLFTKSLYNI